MIKACEHCGTPFQSAPKGNTRHCSADCRRDSSILAVGSVHGRWTVLENHERNARNRQMVKVGCECGTTRTIGASGIKNGKSKSCGCLKAELRSADNHQLTHGRTGTPEWKTYHSAKKRCRNPKDTRYADYGGRGIEFRFESFEEFYAEVGPKPTPKHSINRIDNDGHYEQGNVEWASDAEQRKNKRARRWKVRPP